MSWMKASVDRVALGEALKLAAPLSNGQPPKLQENADAFGYITLKANASRAGATLRAGDGEEVWAEFDLPAHVERPGHITCRANELRGVTGGMKADLLRVEGHLKGEDSVAGRSDYGSVLNGSEQFTIRTRKSEVHAATPFDTTRSDLLEISPESLRRKMEQVIWAADKESGVSFRVVDENLVVATGTDARFAMSTGAVAIPEAAERLNMTLPLQAARFLISALWPEPNHPVQIHSEDKDYGRVLVTIRGKPTWLSCRLAAISLARGMGVFASIVPYRDPPREVVTMKAGKLVKLIASLSDFEAGESIGLHLQEGRIDVLRGYGGRSPMRKSLIEEDCHVIHSAVVNGRDFLSALRVFGDDAFDLGFDEKVVSLVTDRTWIGLRDESVK